MMVSKIKMALSVSLLLSSALLVQTAEAKQSYYDNQPSIYNKGIYCTECHSGTKQTENNANTTYGLLFGKAYDDDNGGGIASAFVTLEDFDLDGDGFSNAQELRQSSGNFNSKSSIPTLTTPDKIYLGHQAKAVTAGAVSLLKVKGTSFANDMTTFEKSDTANATTRTTFMYKFGGMQSGASAIFYDENDNPIPNDTAAGTSQTNAIGGTDTRGILDGSMDILVLDNGAYDLYSQAAFIRIAKARKPTFTPTNVFDVYTGISPDASISPTAQVDPYAVIDAYAIVDNYATVGPYAQVGSYAYIAPRISVNGTATLAKAIIDPYVSVATSIATVGTTAVRSGVGYVQAKFSITTSAPSTSFGGGSGGDGEGGGKTTGLHCMTSGLSLQGLIFLGLFGVGFMIRRKRR